MPTYNESKTKVIEFSGMPKSGKSTAMDTVRDYIRAGGADIHDFHGGGRYAPISKKNLWELNQYLATEAVRYLTMTMVGALPKVDFSFMDRGIFDRVIFTDALLRLDKIDPRDARPLIDWLLSPTLVSQVSTVFVFITSPQLSTTREQKNKLSRREGRVMNETFLRALREATLHCLHEYGERFQAIKLIDTETLDGDIESTAQLIIESIYD